MMTGGKDFPHPIPIHFLTHSSLEPFLYCVCIVCEVWGEGCAGRDRGGRGGIE